MSHTKRYGKQGRIERANQRTKTATLEMKDQRPNCCFACEEIAQKSKALTDFSDIRAALVLTDQQARMYWNWVTELSRKYGGLDEVLDEVSITFTFSPLGRSVVAHTESVDMRTGEHCTLDNL
jgi:hypothetical protein